MLEIHCPFCGPRSESEFINGGAAKEKRADNPDASSDADWINYLMVAPNPQGPVTEEWWHAMGCSMWFYIKRDTVTHKILDCSERSHD
ncbi:MAG: sarcosine oxidase subunit delta [Proteobacteria bacterium]|jgi:sarcosine oxidase, subunit delta|nr:sarcosine oxidase subunit delta [Pseudomonadota bacterium]